MEVPLFHHPGKTEKFSFAKPLKDLIVIIAPSQLLSESKRQELLQKIMDDSSLESSKFETICLSLIHNIINHCQRLPETANSYYAQPGGLLDHALNRTEAALSLFRHYVMQDGGDVSEEQKLWIYALFSAAMLQGIGKLQLDYRVDLFDNNGQLLKQWSPLLESMPSVGSHYNYEFLPEGDHDLRCRLNILLARLLMPASGFSWITSNPEVLAVWLALLSEDARSAGTLGAILIRADAIAIQRYFNELVKAAGHRGGRTHRISTFVDSVPDSLPEKERVMGVEFINWLTQQLQSGQIMVNKAPLFSVPGGLLMSAEIFKWFVREHPEYKNWQAVQKGFLSLGLHQLGTDGTPISRFEQTNTQQMHTGVVFADYAVALPEQLQVHNLRTGNVSSISATEFIHMAQAGNPHFNVHDAHVKVGPLNHLTSSGQWQAVAEKAVTIKPGQTHGG
jgi:integrating conjugative element relaxase (TIGR03760 family)